MFGILNQVWDDSLQRSRLTISLTQIKKAELDKILV